MNQSIFDQFTNLYSLSKTLRFELKPVGQTSQMLEEEKVFAKDEMIQEKYKATKPYFDRLHREFVEESLTNATLSGLETYFEALKNWQNDRKNKELKKVYDKCTQELRSEVVMFFDGKAQEWAGGLYTNIGLKNNDIEILFEEAVFNLLKVRYGEEQGSIIEVGEMDSHGEIVLDEDGQPKVKKTSIFDSWKGFTGYFIKFFATRRNFYKDDGTSTALATRIIDQNLKRFCDNMAIFESLIEKVNFEEVERMFGTPLSQVFSLEFYDQCLLQGGINRYNIILGGETLANGEKRKGLNELINKYRQDHKGEKVPFLKTLDKQILSERRDFLDGDLKNEAELFEIMKKFAVVAKKKTQFLQTLFADFVEKNAEYDLSQIYISKEALNTITHKWTTETDTFEQWLYDAMKGEKLAKYEKKDNSYKFPDFVTLSYIKTALQSGGFEGNFWKDRYYEILGFDEKNGWEQFLAIFSFEFDSLFNRKVKDDDGNEKQIGYDIFSKNFGVLLTTEHFTLSQEVKVTIKEFADSVLNIYQMAKYFAIEKKRAWLTEYETGEFYENPDFGYRKFYENAYEDIVQVYNSLRNFLTKKPYSEEKWKLNFENLTLAGGWDKNKESDNSAVILRKGGRYFLGLMMKGKNKIFDDRFQDKFADGSTDGKYEKVVYKFFPDQAKMFPKVCFSEKGLDFFQPSAEILRIYNNAEFKKGETFSIESMRKLIDFYKDCLAKYEGWKCYDFKHLRSTSEYQENIGEFFRDTAEDGYKISFQDISGEYISERNRNGELYLFEIHNKDWNLNKAKDGQPKDTQKNLHTLYFESLFSPENITGNFPIKLNGQAEIFYRPRTEVEKLGMKKDKQGKEVVNHKRYKENKIFFHVPLTLNRTKSDPFQFNAKINNFLANNPSVNIIGVDRGEKHLAYFSVITQKAEILKSGSLNTINGVNYAEKLEEKARNREQARRDWQAVEVIKDLKKGYISQVVRKLADLAIEYNAIIVFEDLNMRFKQIRGGIEKSIYQQLEKALIEKLNFLVYKGQMDSTKAGYLLKAYQLTAPFETFKDMGKQTGIIFYTQAAYTSRIDPVTGWRPHLYLKYSSAEKAKKDIAKFSKIEFINGRFEFTYDVKNFLQTNEYPKRTVWTVCSNVERFRWDRSLNQNKGGYVHYEDLTKCFEELFTAKGLNTAQDIKAQILAIDEKLNASFFRDFIFFFNLVCQIRNTDNSERAKVDGKDDFIFSPVEPFFDSRNENEKNTPKNGDDNGAYNIARKGIIILRKILDFHRSNDGCEKMNWGDLYVSNSTWDDFANK